MISKKEKIILSAGILLMISEIIKQFLLYFILNKGHYDWWYFPFQLCSLPMYICLLIPFVKKKKALLCFLMDINLLGAVFAFFDTRGMRYPMFILTIHSFGWHIVILGIGIYIGVNYKKSLKLNDYIGAINIYVIAVITAQIVNYVVSKHYVINMFYINPYLKMNQVIFADIAKRLGNNIGIFIYLLAILFGGFIIHCIWWYLGKRDSINGRK